MRYFLIVICVLSLVQTNFAQATTESATAATSVEQSEKVVQEEEKDKTELTEEELNAKVFAAIKAGDATVLAPLLDAMVYYEHNEDGQTALTQAVENDHVELVKLLAKDAVINLKNRGGESPLTLAIKKGNPEIMNLVAVRAKASLKNDLGEAPLFLAIETGQDLRFISKLISKGADINRHSNGETPLSLATSMNELKKVAYLLKQGADVSKVNENGDSPLYIATVKGYDLIAGMLLHKSEDATGDVNWESELGEPLLNIAAESNNASLVATMLEFGADVTATDYMDNTALNIAAKNGNQEMVEALIANGVDINHVNMMGSTAIMQAAKNGHQAIANMLAENGGNPEIRNYAGASASQYANFDAIMVKRYSEETELILDEYEQTKEVDSGIYKNDDKK